MTYTPNDCRFSRSAEAADVVLVLEERALRPDVDRSGHGELMGPMGDTHDIY